MSDKSFSFFMPKYYHKFIHWAMVFLSLIGVVMVTSANMSAFSSNRSLSVIITRQVAFFVISYAMMLIVVRLFTWRYFKYKWFFYGLLAATIILLLVPRLFTAQYLVTGAYNWIDFGIFTIQPSEFAKIVIIVVIAHTLSHLPYARWMQQMENNLSFKEAFKYVYRQIKVPFWAIIMMIGIVLIVQHDLGTAMIMIVISAVMVILANHPLLNIIQKWLIVGVLIVVGLSLILISEPGVEFLARMNVLKGFQLERFRALYHMFDPAYSRDVSPQQYRGLLAFARGGLWGQGLGQSIQKYGYLPEAHSDYIIAIIIEEFGFFGFLVVTILYLIIIYFLIRYALLITYPPSRLTLLGIATYFFAHYFINIGGTSGLIPLTGVPLLLVSSGGSSQMASYIAIGIAQAIIIQYRKEKA